MEERKGKERGVKEEVERERRGRMNDEKGGISEGKGEKWREGKGKGRSGQEEERKDRKEQEKER